MKNLIIICLSVAVIAMGIRINSLTEIVPPQPASAWIKPKFTFSTFEYNPTKVESVVEVTWIADKEEVDRRFAEHESDNLLGLAVYSNGVCTIYAHEPNSRRSFETLGHEMAHCFRGSFHE